MSDIWNEFEKIAFEQGLISEAEEEKKPKPASRNSLSDDAVRLLYGLEPEDIFDAKGKTIVEIAHPETAVIVPTYDAFNGIVENLHQRQDMMAYIALKQPDGHLTQRRYVAAKQELLNSLIRSAFTLDHQNEAGLMVLADSCANRLEKEGSKKAAGFKKVAYVQFIIGGAVLALGLGLYFANSATTARNVFDNSKKVLDALQPLSDQAYASGIDENVRMLIEKVSDIHANKGAIAQVQSVDQALSVAQAQTQLKEIDDLRKKIEDYAKQLQKVYNAIPGWVSKIELNHKISNEESSDWYAKLYGLVSPLVWNQWQTLIDRLHGQGNWFSSGRSGGLAQAIYNELQLMSGVLSSARQQQQEMEALIREKTEGPKPEPTQPERVAVAPSRPEAPNPFETAPQPVPAPAPSPPATGPAAARPAGGFGGTLGW